LPLGVHGARMRAERAAGCVNAPSGRKDNLYVELYRRRRVKYNKSSSELVDAELERRAS